MRLNSVNFKESTREYLLLILCSPQLIMFIIVLFMKARELAFMSVNSIQFDLEIKLLIYSTLIQNFKRFLFQDHKLLESFAHLELYYIQLIINEGFFWFMVLIIVYLLSFIFELVLFLFVFFVLIILVRGIQCKFGFHLVYDLVIIVLFLFF